jgi:hypothetical protein
MNKDSCVIYSGPCFTLEWYYDKQWNSSVYDYFLETTQEQKRRFLILVKYLIKQNSETKETEYTPLNRSLTDICLFLQKIKKIIVASAIYKKTDKLPKNEKDFVLKLRQDYFDRNPGGK